jgi:hypothetical protein
MTKTANKAALIVPRRQPPVWNPPFYRYSLKLETNVWIRAIV